MISLDAPLISIVVPNLNKGVYVREAIDSLLSQSYGHLEILFVDNGSTDGSREIAESYLEHDKRLVCLTEPQRGVSHALNRGLREARGDPITFLGSDDVCSEHRLSDQLNLLRANPEVGACHTDGWIIEQSGKPTGEIYHKDIVPLPRKGFEGDVFLQLLRKNFIIGGSVMLRRSSFEGEAFDVRLESAVDFDFDLRVARRSLFGYVPRPLYGYRIHSGSMPWSSQLSSQCVIYEKCLSSVGLTEDERLVAIRKLLRFYRMRGRYGGIVRLILKEGAARVYTASRLAGE